MPGSGPPRLIVSLPVLLVTAHLVGYLRWKSARAVSLARLVNVTSAAKRASSEGSRAFDWNLRSCGWHGHTTYAPTEEHLRRRMHVPTPAGEAWRCLRCATYVVGKPHETGPAEDAPIVLRGNALKDAFILRLIAAERFIRGLGLGLLAIGIIKFDASQGSLQRMMDTYMPLIEPIADRVGYDLLESGPIELMNKAISLGHGTLQWAAYGVAAYAVLMWVEGTGLWLMKRWGEYVAVVATSVFIPLEIYEIVRSSGVLKVAVLILNVAAVLYIAYSKRLFGWRGGHAAFVAERHSESVLQIEAAAVAPHEIRPPATQRS
jgi:uncharacterized membrane protein (DUF2068 family)